MNQEERKNLLNLMALFFQPRNYHQKRVVAQIFVRRWAIIHGIDLSHPTDVLWCKE